ncbi:unnamed protein product [Auanema sp. JU1783]|nr:unnamed protein product [Auanema sp. JU1783]
MDSNTKLNGRLSYPQELESDDIGPFFNVRSLTTRSNDYQADTPQTTYRPGMYLQLALRTERLSNQLKSKL